MSYSILVIGSLNMDVVNHVVKHPLPGETVKGKGTFHFAGGKGANQAVAAVRSGGQVAMIGAVGADPFGVRLIDDMRAFGVDANGIVVKDTHTGTAYITVSDEGENTIILTEGANGQLSVDDIPFAKLELGSRIVLLQNEIPLETTLAALERCHAQGASVWWNPAPAMAIPERYLALIDTLILNETEAVVLLGKAVDPAGAVDALLKRGVPKVILTLGACGLLFGSGDGVRLRVPAYPVAVADTTGAGDTFIGAYAAAVQLRLRNDEALRFASAAAAISVTRHGAQASIPTGEETLAFLQQRGWID